MRITNVWILLICALCTAPLYAQVGIVATIEGNVRVQSSKEECGLRHGLELEEGDIVRTDAKAWASLRFLDETQVTLRPGTEVRILAYRFIDNNQPMQIQRVLSLSEGSLRVASGKLPLNRNAGFVVKTPASEITLRGTDNEVAYFAPASAQRGDALPGTYTKAYDGEAAVKNARGELSVRPGQVAYADGAGRALPRVLSSEPGFYGSYAAVDRRVEAVRTEVQREPETMSVP